MSAVAMKNLESSVFIIVCDERCAVVKQLAALVKVWDRAQRFRFVDRDTTNADDSKLLTELDASDWSLLLIDDSTDRWHGPESIPIILKNLPFGKIAAVAYILPGTMWLTNQVYMLVSRISRNRSMFVQQST
jgi:predicted DCC family thiol-disulfide oxidoreductase YuxK